MVYEHYFVNKMIKLMLSEKFWLRQLYWFSFIKVAKFCVADNFSRFSRVSPSTCWHFHPWCCLCWMFLRYLGKMSLFVLKNFTTLWTKDDNDFWRKHLTWTFYERIFFGSLSSSSCFKWLEEAKFQVFLSRIFSQMASGDFNGKANK